MIESEQERAKLGGQSRIEIKRVGGNGISDHKNGSLRHRRLFQTGFGTTVGMEKPVTGW